MILAVAARARGGRSEARQHILLDDDPAVVRLDAQRVEHLRNGTMPFPSSQKMPWRTAV